MASLHDASFYCITKFELPTNVTGTEANYRLIYSSVSLTSAGFGFLGSLFHLACWIVNTRRLEGGEDRGVFVNPVIVVCLALANLLSCMGVIIRSTGLLLTNPPKEVCSSSFNTSQTIPSICDNIIEFHPTVCQKTMILGSIFESFTDYCFIAAALWTLAYSADVLKRQNQSGIEFFNHKNRSVTTYNLICWGLPLLFIAGSLVLIYFDTGFPQRCPSETRIQIRYAVVYFPIILVMFINPVLLYKSRALVRRSITRVTATYSSRERDIVRRISFRFFAISVMFILCWVPNIIESLAQVINYNYNSISAAKYQWLFPILILEAIFNPLQGFYNCFTYGVPGVDLCSCCKNKDDDLLSSSMEESQNLLSNKNNLLQRRCVIRRMILK